jgi:polar amino acid transport system substrate-binding protein
MKRFILTLVASGLLFSAAQGAALDAANNETAIHIAADPQAIARIPANYAFVHPGFLTVATSATNSPPIGLWASDNKTLIGSDPDAGKRTAACRCRVPDRPGRIAGV